MQGWREVVLTGIAGLSLLPVQVIGQTGLPLEERSLPQLTESGQILIGGQMTRYLIRHLPVSSFPALPAAIQSQLDRRGCLIPQTYEAHRPENVIRASLERQGSSDWVVLCSAKGTVSLLVFFGGDPGHPATQGGYPVGSGNS